MRMGSEFNPARARVARAAAWHGEVLKRARTSAFVSTNMPSAAVGGYVLGSSGQATPVVVYLIPAHREAFRPGPGVPGGKVSVEIEGAIPACLPWPLARSRRVRENVSHRVDIRLLRNPYHLRSEERVAVAGTDLHTRPQWPMQSRRIRPAVAKNRFELAEGRPPLRLGAKGEKMTGERRIPVSGRCIAYGANLVWRPWTVPRKDTISIVSMGTLPVDRQRTFARSSGATDSLAELGCNPRESRQALEACLTDYRLRMEISCDGGGSGFEEADEKCGPRWSPSDMH